MITVIKSSLTRDAVHASLTDRQRDFVHYLETTFNTKNARGEIFPYRMEPFQMLYHSHSYMAMPYAPDRLINKSRGIGATMMTVCEYLVLIRRYDGLTLPVTSTTDDAAKKLIEWAYFLADHANLDFGVVSDNKFEIVLDNGSKMQAIPGGNPKRFRNIRTITIGFDEFAHCEKQEDIMTAATPCMNEGGQSTVFSTPIGTANMYWRMYSDPEGFSLWVLEVPLFDQDKFNVDRPLQDQVDEGLIPIVPWANIHTLEKRRKLDPVAFMQEYMCSPQDESVSLLSMKLIDDCTNADLYNNSTFFSKNPCYMGVDFAYKRNPSAVSIVEAIKDPNPKVKVPMHIMRHESIMSGVDTEKQATAIEELNRMFNIARITIDCTGPGIGLLHILRKRLGGKVRGVNFAQKVELAGEKTSIKRVMALKLKNCMVEGKVQLIKDSILRRDLNSVPYQSLNAPKSTDLGHGDRFWALALALHGVHGGSNIVVGRERLMGGNRLPVPNDLDPDLPTATPFPLTLRNPW